MIDDFGEIRVRDLVLFDRVATLGSITAAAREMGVPKPTASRWLAALEQRVGHLLVHRTTRQLALSERGEAFHARVRDVLVAVRAARIAGQSDEPGGTIRVSVPVPLGRIVAGPAIAAFRRDLPGVRLEIRLSNDRVDLLRDRFDVAIRGGPLPDSDLIARRLAEVPMWLYASTSYRDRGFESIPVIAAPGDERLLSSRYPQLPKPSVIVDDRTAVAGALRAGAGAGVLPAFLGEPARAEGELVRLGDDALAIMRIHAIYMPSQREDLRLRVLIDHLGSGLRATLDATAGG